MVDPDILLKALIVISRTRTEGENLRDQIMGHLHAGGTSLRTIALYADLDHSTVAKRCKAIEGNLADLETILPTQRHMYPASTIINLAPQKMIAEIVKEVTEYEPVGPDELRRVSTELKALWNLPPELAPPAAVWVREEAETLFDHALQHRDSVRPEECASIYRRAVLAQQWRVEMLGVDALSGLRGRILAIVGRLTVETDRRQT